jgi:endonuclease YncB( thermonuclease family)
MTIACVCIVGLVALVLLYCLLVGVATVGVVSQYDLTIPTAVVAPTAQARVIPTPAPPVDIFANAPRANEAAAAQWGQAFWQLVEMQASLPHDLRFPGLDTPVRVLPHAEQKHGEDARKAIAGRHDGRRAWIVVGVPGGWLWR